MRLRKVGASGQKGVGWGISWEVEVRAWRWRRDGPGREALKRDW